MNWGVIAVLYDGEPTDEARINFAIENAQKLSGADSGDLMIITAGHYQHQAGGTDLVRVVTL